jgi:hypothetical protein
VDNCEGEVKFMNESSNRSEKDQTKLIKGIIDSSDIFDYKYFCGFDIITPKERSDQYNFLNKDIIPYLIKVYFVGGPNSEVWPRTQAIRNKELDLMEELHEYIKSFVPFNIEMMGSHVNSCDGYKKLMKRKYTTDDLQESIRKVLREEDYSPAGKEVTPNNIVIHKSNPMFRDKIMENGLKVRAGECYKIYVGYGVKCKPAIFATNSTNKRAWFDSTYDDDIWFIDTTKIPDVKWFKDRHYESRSKHIVTFQDIPKEAITLKYEGTGSSEDILKSWPEDSPNRLQESIKRILMEEVPAQVRRRIDDYDDTFEKYRKSFLPNKYRAFFVFWNLLMEVTMETIYHVWFKETVSDEDWDDSSDYIIKYLTKKYKDETEQMWNKKNQINESEETNSILHNLINMLFEGFDDIYYDWAEYNCGLGVCCDPYAIGFVLPKNNYDDYIFKLVDSVNYDDDGDYPKELRDELPEVCYESPDIKNPDFDTIVFYGFYAEEIEDYMGPESNWRSDLLNLINKKFGCDAKRIIVI